MQKNKIIITTLFCVLLTACGNKEIKNTGNNTNITTFNKDNSTLTDSEELSLLNQIAAQEKQEQLDNQRNKDVYNPNEHLGELIIKDNTGELEEQPSDSNIETPSEEQSPEEAAPSEEQSPEEEATAQPQEMEQSNSERVAEIEQPNESGAIHYEISENNVIYNGIMYEDLYTNVKKIESQSQYSADTLIKFVIQCYVSDETVYTAAETQDLDLPEDTVEGDSVNMTIDEVLTIESEAYNQICNKYNDRATWRLEMCKWMGKDKAMIVGCKSFTLIIGTDEDVEVDVSDFE